MTGSLVKGTAAWAAGTAIAVTLAWLGAQVVLRDAVAGRPQSPVLGAAAPGSPQPAGSPSPGPRHRPSSPGSPSPSPSPSPSRDAPSPAPSRPAAAGPSPEGTVRSYALSGGEVTLLIARASAQLVTASPAAGFSVQTWSGAGWLRVDFSQGRDVSSLSATWNGHAPAVQTFTDD
jgi:hypothetical protein